MSDDNVEVRVNVMPTTDQLKHTGMQLAVRNVRMVIERKSKKLAITGLTAEQRENVMLAWVGGWAAEWTRLGWPEFTPNREHVDRLMLTSPPPSGEVRPPWAYWMINIPEGLVRTTNGRGEPEHVTRMLCMHLAERWSFTALAQSVEIRQWQQTTEVMRAGAIGLGDDDPRFVELPFDEQDERANAWMCRLLINSVIEAMEATT